RREAERRYRSAAGNEGKVANNDARGVRRCRRRPACRKDCPQARLDLEGHARRHPLDGRGKAQKKEKIPPAPLPAKGCRPAKQFFERGYRGRERPAFSGEPACPLPSPKVVAPAGGVLPLCQEQLCPGEMRVRRFGVLANDFIELGMRGL